MKLLILSDIHANLSALETVLHDSEKHDADGMVFLGDIIDYGMRPNETTELFRTIRLPLVAGIRGNHEDAIFSGGLSRFSSDRGRAFSQLTGEMLSDTSREYILGSFECSGRCEKLIDGKKYLFIHGSADDALWGSITPDTDATAYADFDYVFSGHSHRPHFFEKYLRCDDEKMRFQKKITFINPGSVGQPRNHNSNAQYCVFNTATGAVDFCRVPYDIAGEQALYDERADKFYCERLLLGV